MAHKVWRVERIRYCEHVRQEVRLEDEVIYPAEHLPDPPPRITAHRCSHALECNLMDKPACGLCGTNPDIEAV